MQPYCLVSTNGLLVPNLEGAIFSSLYYFLNEATSDIGGYLQMAFLLLATLFQQKKSTSFPLFTPIIIPTSDT